MKIGPHRIHEGAFLAPMAGITNPPFRQLCREMGAALTTTELISSHALIYLTQMPSLSKKKLGIKTLALLERYPGENPLAVQIFGRDPDQMAEAAHILEAEGIDILDLNFGCPARKVVKNGHGSGVALMRSPALLQEIASKVVSSVSIPVTAKIRAGWSQNALNAPEVARRMEDVGIQAVCVHARTRDQLHSGPVNLDILAATCSKISIPVIGNGGIRSYQDAREMMNKTGCQRVAVGQASKGNPWIFKELLGGDGHPGMAEQIDTFRIHFDLYVRWAGEQRAVMEIRKHACWYLKGFKGAAALRARLMRATQVDAILGLLDVIPID